MTDGMFKLLGAVWFVAAVALAAAVVAAVAGAAPAIVWTVALALAVMIAAGAGMICGVMRNEAEPDPLADLHLTPDGARRPYPDLE